MSVITNKDDLDRMIDYYLGEDAFAFDVETIGTDRIEPLRATVAWISFATHGRTDVIPVGHPNGELVWERPKPNSKGRERMLRGVPYEDLNPKYDLLVELEREFTDPPDQLDRFYVFDRLIPLFQSEALKVGHNIKFDLHSVQKYMDGQYPVGPYYDTMIAPWVLDASLGSVQKGRRREGLGLKECAKRELGVVMDKDPGKDVSQYAFSVVAKYSLLDADVTWRLYQTYSKKFLSRPRLQWVMDLEMEVMNAIIEMESNGVLIDEHRLREIGDELLRDMDSLKAQMYRMAGRPFNLRSNRDKQEILFRTKRAGGLGLKPTKLTPGGEKKADGAVTILDYSVDHEVLAQYEREPFVAALLAYNAKAKLHGTYVLPYTGGVTHKGEQDKEVKVDRKLHLGRIFAQFVQHGAESGRMSSRNPNLQNVPSRSDDGKKLREVFVADPGHVLICADYSQVEPRIIASLSGDKTMISTYRDGGDVYMTVAERMGVTRDAGKELVLSISYGIGPTRIASRINCSVGEARDLMEFFADKFSAIPKHRNLVVARARRDKFSETIFGRRRPFPRITSGDDLERSGFERQAYNFVIQGSAADIMKIALTNMQVELPQEAQMLMAIHDEVVVQCPEDMVEEVTAIVRREMEMARPGSMVVPLVADVGNGHSWAASKP